MQLVILGLQTPELLRVRRDLLSFLSCSSAIGHGHAFDVADRHFWNEQIQMSSRQRAVSKTTPSVPHQVITLPSPSDNYESYFSSSGGSSRRPSSSASTTSSISSLNYPYYYENGSARSLPVSPQGSTSSSPNGTPVLHRRK